VSRGTRIIGLGNPLRGDDGVGVRVAEILNEQALPEGVDVVDGGTRGLDLVNLMEGWSRVILVDAVHLDREPGQFVRFTPDQVRLLGKAESLSIHEAGLREALMLADALDVLPDNVILYGVQPAHVDWVRGLSPEVEAAVPQLVNALLEEVNRGGPASFDDGRLRAAHPT
jgi:hydrogenase maturation protease